MNFPNESGNNAYSLFSHFTKCCKVITQNKFVKLFFQHFQRMNPLFRYIVFFPTLLSIIYFSIIASPVYLSESRFIIYDAKEDFSTNQGLSGLLKSFSGSYSTNASQTVNAYIGSWDAMMSLNQHIKLRDAYGDGVDFLDRFGGLLHPFKSDVKLLRYYQNMTTDEIDSTTGISKLMVRAYSAKDAQTINQVLLEKSQEIVNHLNANARQQALNYAENDVKKARKALWEADYELATYRNKHDVINPLGQSKLQLSMVTKLQNQLIADKIKLYSIQEHAPKNPNIPILQSNIYALQKEITKANATVTGNNESLASKDTEYERFSVNHAIAQKLLEAAVVSLEQARIAAQKQNLYLETVSQPNLPDVAQYPKRLEGIAATLVITLMLWGVMTIVIGGVREHHA